MQALSDVFSRSGSSSISARTFYGLTAGLICYGLLLNFLITKSLINIGFTMGGFGKIIWFLVAVAGIFASLSRNIVISMIGYTFIIIPMSVLMAVSLINIAPDIIQHAALLTLLITVIMGTAGVIFPNFFSKIGLTLFVVLTALVIVRLIGIFFPAFSNMSIWDYIAAGLFSLYIGFDMWRASTIEHSVKNALDVSVSLYLDIINLFISLLSILSKADD